MRQRLGAQARQGGRSTRARDYVEYGALRILAGLLRIFPVETGAQAMGALWGAFGTRSGRNRRVLANLELAFPELAEAERFAIARAQWDNLGRTFAEALLIDRIIASDRVELAISPELDSRLREPGGFVVTALHSANWEVAALPIGLYRPVIGLYQALGNPLAERYVLRLRRQVFGAGLVTKAADAAGRVMRWVRDGNAVALLADHREGRGIDVIALGRPTRANPFPAMVARRLGVRLIAGRSVRLPGSRFRVEACEIDVARTGDPRADVQAATQAIQDQFDVWIRERPGEWMWVQNRWLGRAGPSRTEKRKARVRREQGSCQPGVEGPDSSQ